MYSIKGIALCSNRTYGSDISIKEIEGVCPPFVHSIFFREFVAKNGNSTVCSSDCHYSENTKLNRKVA